MDALVKESLMRKYSIFALLAVIPAGFLSKFYSGPAQWWFNNYGAGLLYEVFWILVVFLFIPKKRYIRKIPVYVFVITCTLEVLQLWQPWFLQKLRSYFLGKALIGTSFVWCDFPHYVIGCVIGWLLIKSIHKLCQDKGRGFDG